MARGTVVFDASTAILLAKVALLEDVTRATLAWMPRSAFEEVRARRGDDTLLMQRLVAEGRLRLAEPHASRRDVVEQFRLDRGEADTILLAREMGGIAATDDGPAIRACKVAGVRFATAIHFLVASMRDGLLTREEALEKLALLERLGRYSARILADAAVRLREAPPSGHGGRRR